MSTPVSNFVCLVYIKQRCSVWFSAFCLARGHLTMSGDIVACITVEGLSMIRLESSQQKPRMVPQRMGHPTKNGTAPTTRCNPAQTVIVLMLKILDTEISPIVIELFHVIKQISIKQVKGYGQILCNQWPLSNFSQEKFFQQTLFNFYLLFNRNFISTLDTVLNIYLFL